MAERLDWQIQNLATVLRPGTIILYRYAARSFLSYLKTHHPAIRRLSELRRNPHTLGWLRSLYEQQPPLANKTRMERIIDLRRLLRDLAASSDPPREDLFAPGDYPPRDQYLPRPLSPEDDQRLQQRLRERATLRSLALLLLRATGMRIGECLQLTADSLRELGRNQWAIRVPLGKLHTERWVPIHQDTRRIFNDILFLRSDPTPTRKAESSAWLLQEDGRRIRYLSTRKELILAARDAGCSVQPTPHQLRHTFATELLRAGASLPAVKQLLGHRALEMTLRYVQVSQVDLQREYHQARQRMGQLYRLPKLKRPAGRGILALRELLAEVAHLMDMHRRHQDDDKIKKKLARLINRIAKISSELKRMDRSEK